MTKLVVTGLNIRRESLSHVNLFTDFLKTTCFSVRENVCKKNVKTSEEHRMFYKKKKKSSKKCKFCSFMFSTKIFAQTEEDFAPPAFTNSAYLHVWEKVLTHSL